MNGADSAAADGAENEATDGAADDFPTGYADERELLLAWLRFLRGAVLRDLAGLTEEQARWRPDGALISVLGVVKHLTGVEWRWIEGGIRGAETWQDEEAEFRPGPELTVPAAVAAYRERAAATEAAVRALPLTTPCRWGRAPTCAGCCSISSTRPPATPATPTPPASCWTAPPASKGRHARTGTALSLFRTSAR